MTSEKKPSQASTNFRDYLAENFQVRPRGGAKHKQYANYHKSGIFCLMTSPDTLFEYKTFDELQAEWGLTKYEQQFIDDLGGDLDIEGIITPNDARGYLTNLGVEEFNYLGIINQGGMSHQERACIVIATGESPRLGWLLSMNFRKIDVLAGIQHSLAGLNLRDELVVNALRNRLIDRV